MRLDWSRRALFRFALTGLLVDWFSAIVAEI